MISYIRWIYEKKVHNMINVEEKIKRGSRYDQYIRKRFTICAAKEFVPKLNAIAHQMAT